jgi:hypothetical protein
VAGELRIVPSADLGGLGAKEGLPLAYNWTRPSLLPPLLPWLGVLLLLAFKPNRNPQAWWVFVPLAVVGGVAWALQAGLEALPYSPLGEMVEVPLALVFGFAAVWLLTPALRRTHWLLTCLMLLFALAGLSAGAFLLKQSGELGNVETIGLATAAAVGAAAMVVALTLAGLLCRHRYDPVRLCLWLLTALLGVWGAGIAVFFVCLKIFNSSYVPFWVPFVIVAMAVGISFATLLPFLPLVFANGFFRERLQQLLHLESPLLTPPPLGAEPRPAAPVVGSVSLPDPPPNSTKT